MKQRSEYSPSGFTVSIGPPARQEKDWEAERRAHANREHLSEEQIIQRFFPHWSHEEFVIAGEHPTFPRACNKMGMREIFNMPVHAILFTYPAEEVAVWARDTYPDLQRAGVVR